jgi:hypothetical protein
MPSQQSDSGAEIPSLMVERLEKDLDPLNKLDAGIADRLVRFVIRGEFGDTLPRLIELKGAASELGLCLTRGWGDLSHSRDFKERALLLRPENPQAIPPEFWYRLAQVYATARRTQAGVRTLISYWPEELELFLREIIAVQAADLPGKANEVRWTCAELAAIWHVGGCDSGAFLSGLLDPAARESMQQGAIPQKFGEPNPFANRIDGIPALLAQHSDSLSGSLRAASAENRLELLTQLSIYQCDFSTIVDVVGELAVGKAKLVREKTQLILETLGATARPALERLLISGDAPQRNEAASALHRLFGDAAAPFLIEHAETEKSKRVVQTIRQLTATLPPMSSSSVTSDVMSAARAGDPVVASAGGWPPQLPVINSPLGIVELTRIGREGLCQFINDAIENLRNVYNISLERFNRPDRPGWLVRPTEPKPLGKQELDELIEFSEGKAASNGIRDFSLWSGIGDSLLTPGDWYKPPHFELIHVIRLEYAFGNLRAGRGCREIGWVQNGRLESYRADCGERPFGLLEVDAAVATLNRFEAGDVTRSYLVYNSQWTSFCDWESSAIWPAFVAQLGLLKEFLQSSPNRGPDHFNYDYAWPTKKQNAFRVLAMFPAVPPMFTPALWALALGESKTDRPSAQAALVTMPGRVERAIEALSDGKQGVRWAAADWLGRLDDSTAVEPLKKALRKEKQELVKAAVIGALELLGADVHEFLDRDRLYNEAVLGIQKKPPQGAEWLSMGVIPQLHWLEDQTYGVGDLVPPEVVQWWLIQSVKQKSAAANPLQRRYLQQCVTSEAADFALFVLNRWIAADTQTVSHEEAMANAKQSAASLWSLIDGTPWGEKYKSDMNNFVQELYQNQRQQCIGSAIAQKGLLALVSAAGDQRCVALCEQYIHRWYGQRAAQCKALLEVLSWLDSPQAIQVLLSIANRFRTKSIQKAAQEYVDELAERQGWTVDQLADRTIPDGGFEREKDENGLPVGDKATLVIDYGGRTFEVHLDDELKPIVTNDDGKIVKTLPAPGSNDDEGAAKAGRKAFNAAKKTVKDVVKRQTDRLYEAMCTGQEWPAIEWQRYLLGHPIVGKLCGRLVWLSSGEGVPAVGFRPLEDGTFTDVIDNEISLGPDSRITIGHTCRVSDQEAVAWRSHLVDYDIATLFAQFRGDVYVLAADKGNARSLPDFQGHMTTSLKLRTAATKLGYVRGDTADSVMFTSYRKVFQAFQLQVVVGFSGSYLPEEDIPVALTELSFETHGESVARAQPVPLQKIPPVLLSECYNDVKQIADGGGGHDPEWQSKSFM